MKLLAIFFNGDHGEARAEGMSDSISTDSGRLCSVAFLFDRSGGWGSSKANLCARCGFLN